MSTANAYLTVAGINVDVIYKDIKHIHVGVYPPLGRVRVAAPQHLDEERVRLAVVRRLPWIRKNQLQLRAAERQTHREMLTGESHYVGGRRHRLEVIETPGRSRVVVSGDRLVLRVPQGTSFKDRALVLERWHRRQLRERISELIAEWQPRIERPVSGWAIRRMKTKWGSCNREAGRLWFNLELAKKHPRCVEYIVVHELAHLVERGHGQQFIDLMDSLLPDWRARRDELNAAPLAAEEWTV